MERNIKSNNDKTKFLFKIFFGFILLLAVFLLPQYSNKSYATEQDAEFCYLSDIPYVANKSSVGWDEIKYDTTYYGDITISVEGANYTFKKGIWAHATSSVVYDLTNYSGYDYFTAYLGINTSSPRGDGVEFDILTSQDGVNWESKLEAPIDKQRLQDATFVEVDIKNAKFLKLFADDKNGNSSDHSVYADAKLIKESYKNKEEVLVPTTEELDAKIKQFVASNADVSTNKEYELTLLKRELISRTGNYALKRFLGESEENRLVYEWLTGDVDILRLYVMGGLPDGGNYYNSLSILAKLYKEYSNDFENTELLNNPTYPEMTYGDLYKKMAMSIALTHSQRIGLWMNSSVEINQSDVLRRYAIFKYMHKNGRMVITSSMDMTHMFEDLHVEEMRLVIANAIDDEEILWLNRYVQDNVDANPNNVWRYTTPHPYIAYVWPNYGNPIYFDPANVSYFNELFAINKTDDNVGTELEVNGEKTGKVGIFDSEFVIPGGKNIPEYRLKITRGTEDNKVYKLWMNFRNKFGTGCVCGGISKSGHNIRGTHGIPAIVVGQPGHAALLFYTKDAEGRGYWRIDNDVSGWTATGKSARFLGWGSGSHTYGYSTGVYMEFEQAAVNDYENLIKAEEQVMIAKVYNGDLADATKKQATLRKQEEIYRKALEIQPINFDAWLGLINVYNANEAKTEDDFYNLAEEIAETLKYFPLPMLNATDLIKPRLTSTENSYKFTLLQTRILTEASTLPNNTADSFTVMQPGVTRLEANYLLGKLDKTIATFSFDGEDAGKIVLSDRFDNTGVRWDYSLDGKNTWHEVSFSADEEHKLQLTQGQINSITAENDIYVHVVGVNYDEKNLYKIDITAQTISDILYGNDLENRVIGVDLTYEWRNLETDLWTSYKVASPNNTGNKTLQVRIGATGTCLASEAKTFTFTEDNQPDNRKYVSISHLELNAFSEENTKYKGQAVNAIDGNFNTFWYNNVSNKDLNPSITIKLDKPRYISAVEIVPHILNNYGRLKAGVLMGSTDGENWVELKRFSDLPTDYDVLKLEIDDPKEVRYLKIDADTTNFNNYFFVKMINVFQDLTINPRPTAGIAYSTTEPTNGTVLARLINPSTDITITNNDGKDSYVFTENGEFTFEFQDQRGNTGSAVAKVTWIDKDGPTADINYDLDDDKKLRVIFDNISEDVYLLDENNNKINYIEVNANKKVTNITYLDNQGNAYKVLDKDEKGNTKKITYKNTTGNVSNVATYITTLENGIVTKEEYFDIAGNLVTLEQEDQKEILRELQQTTRSNPLEYALETSGEYEFKLLDKAENLLYKSIKVDYIDNNAKILASDITYNITKQTNTDVKATLNPYIIDTSGNKDENVTITSDGGNTHTFTENGRFTFQYKESIDQNNLEVKAHEASVNWIDKTVPTAEITYSTQESTSKEVIATLTNPSEDITITNNGGNNSYAFTENGDFTFKFIDKAGNEGTATAHVTWIDKTLPVATITYSTTELTNQDVTATITFDKENVTVAGGFTHTFTENGSYEFKYTTEQGNTAVATARVNWIDKKVPVATITYSKTEPTNQDVIAMLSFDENNVAIKGGNGHRFTENGKYTFEFEDLAGNKGTIEAVVNWIDKTAPTATIKYSETNLTNKDVIATISFNEENVTVTGGNTHTFTENGEFTFEFIDRAGNKGTLKAVVNWIDKKVPVATIEYSETKPTNKNVVATIKFDEENVTVTGGNTHTFTENGEFTFEFVDRAGNIGTLKAVVNWIDKNIKDEDKPIIDSTKYKIEDNFISMIRPGIDDKTVTTVKEFKENVTTNQKLQFLDKNGKALGDNDSVVTGMKLKVGENKEYTLIVKGDTDGDGKVTINDLARLKLHCIEQELLQGAELKAANVDTDNIITINDLAVIKLVLIGLEEI